MKQEKQRDSQAQLESSWKELTSMYPMSKSSQHYPSMPNHELFQSLGQHYFSHQHHQMLSQGYPLRFQPPPPAFHVPAAQSAPPPSSNSDLATSANWNRRVSATPHPPHFYPVTSGSGLLTPKSVEGGDPKTGPQVKNHLDFSKHQHYHESRPQVASTPQELGKRYFTSSIPYRISKRKCYVSFRQRSQSGLTFECSLPIQRL